MEKIYDKFVSGGCHSIVANQKIDVLIQEIGVDGMVELFTKYDARWNDSTQCVDIRRACTGEVVNSISECVGEINHMRESYSILYSLVYDSMMSVDDIVGR